MIPDPLHPAVVHIPIGIAVILPFLILLALYFLRCGIGITGAWLPIVALAFTVFAGALIAKQSGGQEEEIVESVVAESYIETHEENAEVFTIFAGILLALTLVGLTTRKFGRWPRWAAAIVSVVLLGLAFRTGHTGGQLVYRHGAASVSRTEVIPADLPVKATRTDDHEEYDDDE